MNESACRTFPAFLAGLMAVSCTAPQPNASAPSPVTGMDRHTGAIVETEGDVITVLIGDQMAKIRLEGFAAEGGEVAASVARSPAHTMLAAPR